MEAGKVSSRERERDGGQGMEGGCLQRKAVDPGACGGNAHPEKKP